MMLGRTTAALAGAMVVATLVTGCMKATSSPSAGQIAQLVDSIDTVAQWSRGPDRKPRTAWLDRAIAWDLVGAVDMTTAAPDIDPSKLDATLRSGLAELAAGPGDHIASLVQHWRRDLGSAACHSGDVTDDDVRWARDKLTFPLPRAAAEDIRRAMAAYADRAKAAHDFVRIDCGGPARLVVGVLDDRLVPLLRK